MMMHTLGLQVPGMGEWIVIAAIGLLFFGKRLPEVGKSVAGAIVNFKKGLKEAQEEIDTAGETRAALPPANPPVAALPADAKFDPYTGKPIEAPKPKFDPYTGQPMSDADTVVTHGQPQPATPMEH